MSDYIAFKVFVNNLIIAIDKISKLIDNQIMQKKYYKKLICLTMLCNIARADDVDEGEDGDDDDDTKEQVIDAPRKTPWLKIGSGALVGIVVIGVTYWFCSRTTKSTDNSAPASPAGNR